MTIQSTSRYVKVEALNNEFIISCMDAFSIDPLHQWRTTNDLAVAFITVVWMRNFTSKELMAQLIKDLI